MQYYQAADRESDEDKPEIKNPLLKDNLGLAGSRYATKVDENKKVLHPKGQKIQQASHSRYNKKNRRSSEEAAADQAVKDFFADSPKGKEKVASTRKHQCRQQRSLLTETWSQAREQPYEAADHNTPRAKMENPVPKGNLGLKGSLFYVPPKEEEPKDSKE